MKKNTRVKERKIDRERCNWPWTAVISLATWVPQTPLHLRIATEMLLVLFLPPFLWKTQCLPFLPLRHPVISPLLWWTDMSEISDLTWVRFLICHTLRLFALKLERLCNTSIFISIYNVIQQQRGPEKCKGLIDIWPHEPSSAWDQVSWSSVALKLNHNLGQTVTLEYQRAAVQHRKWKWSYCIRD